MSESISYTVSDGQLVLTLTPEEGIYIVRSPMDPELLTYGKTVEEAFEMARDAMQALKDSRAKLVKQVLAAGA